MDTKYWEKSDLERRHLKNWKTQFSFFTSLFFPCLYLQPNILFSISFKDVGTLHVLRSSTRNVSHGLVVSRLYWVWHLSRCQDIRNFYYQLQRHYQGVKFQLLWTPLRLPLTYIFFLKLNCQRMFSVIYTKLITIIHNSISDWKMLFVLIVFIIFSLQGLLVGLTFPCFDTKWIKLLLDVIYIFICFLYLSPNLYSTQHFLIT